MRRHLDQDNQMINPTIKRAQSALARGGNKDLSPVQERDSKENPANTAKFSAYVETRRQKMEDKKNKEQAKFQEEVERFFKQNRLAQRVKCSPALVSNAAELAKRKKTSLRKARAKNAQLERVYAEQKESILFNVANKPLLVEQVSKAFMRNLAQIRELQRYVNILRDAGRNPDDHLTDE